ncbi:MAG TPA: FAD-dependent oxidoreductase [Streptosporangiaceae bacterium]
MSQAPAQVVVVGSGFAGFFAARKLARILPRELAEVTMVSATDHLGYSPLLPEVAAGRLDPQRIAVPLHGSLGCSRILQGRVEAVDFESRKVRVRVASGEEVSLPYDRLVLAVGSVTREVATPGLSEFAFGLKTLAEGQFIHDHVLQQLELADATTDPEARRARLTFLVVGAGYTGTETAAQLQRMTQKQLSSFPSLSASDLRWLLVDRSPTILPELGPRLGRYTLRLLRRRGMDIRLGTTVTAMRPGEVELSDGTVLPCRTALWTVGVTPPPIVDHLGLPVRGGRLVVDEYLKLCDHVWAAGDSAAASDPYDHDGVDYPPTAQHAQRQGTVIARNVAASLGVGTPRAYRHRDLGLVADLGGTKAVARPFGLPLTGLPAKVVTKGYHLGAIPHRANKLRVAADWLVNLVSRPTATQLGLVQESAAQLRSEYSDELSRPAGTAASASAESPRPRPVRRS